MSVLVQESEIDNPKSEIGLGFLLPVFRPEVPNLGARPPHLRIGHLGQLGIQLFPVVRLTVPVEDNLCLGPVGNPFIEINKERSDGIAKLPFPVQCSPLGGG